MHNRWQFHEIVPIENPKHINDEMIKIKGEKKKPQTSTISTEFHHVETHLILFVQLIRR